MIASYNWKTACGGYAVRFTDSSCNQMERECTKAGRIETGGILVGYYTDDGLTAVVTEALQPPTDSSHGRTWFHRGIAGLRRLLAARWLRNHRTYYIGEWHYHPANIIEPSDDDVTQMREIRKDSRYKCKEPIMAIIGSMCTKEGHRPFRAFVFPYDETYLEFRTGSEI